MEQQGPSYEQQVNSYVIETNFTLRSVLELVKSTKSSFLVQCVHVLNTIEKLDILNPTSTMDLLNLASTHYAQTKIEDFYFGFSSTRFLSDEDVEYFMQIFRLHPHKIQFFKVLLSQLGSSRQVPTKIIQVVKYFLVESVFSLSTFFIEHPISWLYLLNLPNEILVYLHNLYFLHTIDNLFRQSTSTSVVDVNAVRDQVQHLIHPVIIEDFQNDPKLSESIGENLSQILLQNLHLFSQQDLCLLSLKSKTSTQVHPP